MLSRTKEGGVKRPNVDGYNWSEWSPRWEVTDIPVPEPSHETVEGGGGLVRDTTPEWPASVTVTRWWTTARGDVLHGGTKVYKP